MAVNTMLLKSDEVKMFKIKSTPENLSRNPFKEFLKPSKELSTSSKESSGSKISKSKEEKREILAGELQVIEERFDESSLPSAIISVTLSPSFAGGSPLLRK